MVDKRTKRKKLEAMANQTESPNEAEIAKRLLEKQPPDPPEPKSLVSFRIIINGVVFEFTHKAE